MLVLEHPAVKDLHDLGLCESAVLISTNTAAKLLCGLRCGTVVVFDFTISGSCKFGGCVSFWGPSIDILKALQLERRQEVKFGPIPVLLSVDMYRKDSAFALAGREVYRFDMPRDKFRAAQVIVVMPNEDIDVGAAPDSSLMMG